MVRISAIRLSDKIMHKRGLLSFKGKERPSREIAAVFSFGEGSGPASGLLQVHANSGADEVRAGFSWSNEPEDPGTVVDLWDEVYAGQRCVRELRLDGEIVEEAARLDPEAAFEIWSLRGIGEPLAEGQIEAHSPKSGIWPVRNMSATVP